MPQLYEPSPEERASLPIQTFSKHSYLETATTNSLLTNTEKKYKTLM
ncbi:hypothetical protein NG800_012065 [Epilithonimonas ginsengisoli]|uniref:Uncharacterized protein n=1 Tax=Epilithonimonas ginsengisoli TaxID=1245592 RepID=A0ABU4JIZ7_9FLAO|nr:MULTISPECIES: hypothetical protein [Chryseobacterium group]MBV6880781.1 hypothetical protein [Epilithonimonas sp. FP105]MDW8549649.1 hypothetical protein [Epilithonimonas ginsengisoli]